MKISNSRNISILGGVLAATFIAAGCWSGGQGYSNNPYGYNGNSYSSGQYRPAYTSTYPNGNGYNEGRSQPEYSTKNAYNEGYHAGVNADTSRDHRDNQAAVAHVAPDHSDHQAQTNKEHSSVAHNDYSKDKSGSEHESEKN